jgi:hypothetical protein
MARVRVVPGLGLVVDGTTGVTRVIPGGLVQDGAGAGPTYKVPVISRHYRNRRAA